MSLRYRYLAPSPSGMSVVVTSRTEFPKNELFFGALVAAIGVLLGFLFCCIKKYFRSNKQESVSKDTSQKIKLRRFGMNELQKATNNFSQKCLVGSGAFGNVYKGIFDDKSTFAIKRAQDQCHQSILEFKNEVELLSRVKHNNLVELVGYCQEAGQKILVYEYVPNGSLLEYIAGMRRALTWRQRVNIAIGAAKGIAHLHEGIKPSIIHRDIKPSNILVGDKFEAKVSDFGLVKSGPEGDESHVSSQIKGTPGYLDPAYCSSFHLTLFTDVYSFGVILLQLVAARPALTSRNLTHIIDWARPSLERGSVEDVLDVNLITEGCNMEMMLKMGQLGLRCAAKNPKDRPTMREISQELEEKFYSTSTFVHKQPSLGHRRSLEGEESQSSVSMDAMELQRFHVATDDLLIPSASMKCLDVTTISIDVENPYLSGIEDTEESLETISKSNYSSFS